MPDLCDSHLIRETLARYGFRFSKTRGQNFLVDPTIPERIAALAGPQNAVLEIGPGFGALTEALCRRAGHVTAVEIDRLLLPVLRENLKEFGNLTITPGDALRLPLDTLLPPNLSPMVCANLPYSVTSPLLARLLEYRRFDPIVVMIQREVAERLCARAGTPEYGAFTLFAGLYATPEILFEVGPESFMPRPAVHSAVVRLSRHLSPPVPEDFQSLFLRVVRAAFAQRRKTLANALSAGLALPRGTVADCIASAGLSPMQRGETLDREAFARLTEKLAPLLRRDGPKS